MEQILYPFSVVTFARLCQHLEVSADDLLAGLPPPDRARAARIKKALARRRCVPA